MPTKWEIWYARFKYEDVNEYKERPVLVLENRFVFPILVAKITSHEPRENYNGEYLIKNWAKAGLSKESTIRLSQILKLEKNDFVKKVGKLQAYDIYNVMQEIKNMK